MGAGGWQRATSMSVQRFTIPGELPTLNEYIDAERGNRFAASKMKAHWTGHAYQWARAAYLLPVQRYPVRVRCTWWLKDRRKDLDNVRFGVKFILDGLQVAGVLLGDGQQYVAELVDTFGVDKANPRVEVSIEEMGL
jgi:Holliday junction resolvase RusA-like endonuclease